MDYGKKMRTEDLTNNQHLKVVMALEVFAIKQGIIPEDFYTMMTGKDVSDILERFKGYYKWKVKFGEFEGTFIKFIESKSAEKEGSENKHYLYSTPDADEVQDAKIVKDLLEKNKGIFKLGTNKNTLLNLYQFYAQDFFADDLPNKLVGTIAHAMRSKYGSINKAKDLNEKGVFVIFCRKQECSEIEECLQNFKKGIFDCMDFRNPEHMLVSNDTIKERAEKVIEHINANPKFF